LVVNKAVFGTHTDTRRKLTGIIIVTYGQHGQGKASQ
jgi:hypothetical protein